MADYWKSNPRHYCEVCKCWFGDNKASIDFHEGGRRHKANVERMLKETRKKATNKDKEQLKLSETLSQIESAAMVAYKKDVAGISSTADPGAASAKSSKKTKQKFKYKPPTSSKKGTPTIAAHVSAPIAEAMPLPEGVVPPPPPSPWQQFTSPDGHQYYYNVLTGESQWEQPSGFIPPPPLPQTIPVPTEGVGATATTITTVAAVATEAPATITPATTVSPQPDVPMPLTMSLGMKHVLSEPLINLPKGYDTERDGPPSPKRLNPYGSWITISTRRQEIPKEETSDEEEEDESDKEESEQEHEEKEETIVTPGTFKGFGFNKKPVKKQIFISTKTTTQSTNTNIKVQKDTRRPVPHTQVEREVPKQFAEDSSDEEETYEFQEKATPENTSGDTFQNVKKVAFKKRTTSSKANIKQRTTDW